ncbi:MAG TPA: BadF/BadG/BcrA/BcrD ATPase family protein [Anaerolineales bacterium]|nr:BadF/BadG/BcrA/BcrD ATPase family protein [Anaerolineales bacterium]
MRYFLGADLGGTKTHALIADETGQIVGFGKAGPGNPQNIGHAAMLDALTHAVDEALTHAHLTREHLSGAGFSIAGYDWPSDKPPLLAALKQLHLPCPFLMVNDTIPGIVAGTKEGWGISLVAGTGCNCRGWDRTHQREGRVTGYSLWMGEAAGAGELVARAMQVVGYAWGKRLPPTALSEAFIAYVGAKNLDDLLEGYTTGRYSIGPEAAHLVFEIAQTGDDLATRLICWAGEELGELANSVIRQLEFETLSFEVVMIGGLFVAGGLLIESLRTKIHTLAPGAELVRLHVSPVIGSVMIGMEQGGWLPTPGIRQRLIESFQEE